MGIEWYPRNMYQPGSDENKHQVATYGPLTKFGYKDFIPMFKAEHFDAHAWAVLFRQSGAKYVVPVLNIMMDLQCTTADYQIGPWSRWGRAGTSTAIWQRK